MRARRRLRTLHGPVAPRFSPALRFPRAASAVLAGAVGVGVGVAAGPVGAVVATFYSHVAARAWLRHRRTAAATAARSRALDALTGLAADLRAGRAPGPARAAAAPHVDGVPLIRDRVVAAWRVADVTGAPLADLLDRLEVDLRSLERVRLAAAGPAARTPATARVLVGVPGAGGAGRHRVGGGPPPPPPPTPGR